MVSFFGHSFCIVIIDSFPGALLLNDILETHPPIITILSTLLIYFSYLYYRGWRGKYCYLEEVFFVIISGCCIGPLCRLGLNCSLDWGDHIVYLVKLYLELTFTLISLYFPQNFTSAFLGPCQCSRNCVSNWTLEEHWLTTCKETRA